MEFGEICHLGEMYSIHSTTLIIKSSMYNVFFNRKLRICVNIALALVNENFN